MTKRKKERKMAMKDSVIRGSSTYIVVAMKGDEFIGYRWSSKTYGPKFCLTEDAMKSEVGVAFSTTGQGLTLTANEYNFAATKAMFVARGYELDPEAFDTIEAYMKAQKATPSNEEEQSLS